MEERGGIMVGVQTSDIFQRKTLGYNLGSLEAESVVVLDLLLLVADFPVVLVLFDCEGAANERESSTIFTKSSVEEADADDPAEFEFDEEDDEDDEDDDEDDDDDDDEDDDDDDADEDDEDEDEELEKLSESTNVLTSRISSDLESRSRSSLSKDT